jgi:multiple sugar transport system permease protein
VFDIIFGTTGGGPQGVTESMQVYAYRKAISFLQMSEGMTIMVVFSILVVALCLVYVRMDRRAEADL